MTCTIVSRTSTIVSACPLSDRDQALDLRIDQGLAPGQEPQVGHGPAQQRVESLRAQGHGPRREQDRQPERGGARTDDGACDHLNTWRTRTSSA